MCGACQMSCPVFLPIGGETLFKVYIVQGESPDLSVSLAKYLTQEASRARLSQDALQRGTHPQCQPDAYDVIDTYATARGQLGHCVSARLRDLHSNTVDSGDGPDQSKESVESPGTSSADDAGSPEDEFPTKGAIDPGFEDNHMGVFAHAMYLFKMTAMRQATKVPPLHRRRRPLHCVHTQWRCVYALPVYTHTGIPNGQHMGTHRLHTRLTRAASSHFLRARMGL